MSVLPRRRRQHSEKTDMQGRLITIECDGNLPLEERYELLSYAFAKVIQGAILMEIVEWHIKDGCIKIVVGGGAAEPGPLGRVQVTVEAMPGIKVTEEPIKLHPQRGKKAS
jgi:hypothetical protein